VLREIIQKVASEGAYLALMCQLEFGVASVLKIPIELRERITDGWIFLKCECDGIKSAVEAFNEPKKLCYNLYRIEIFMPFVECWQITWPRSAASVSTQPFLKQVWIPRPLLLNNIQIDNSP
jgi:hypothetical protein